MIAFYCYVGWCLVNICLFIFASSAKRFPGEVYSKANFYPFDKPLSIIIQGKQFDCSLIKYANVYDYSELFVYTILIPFMLLGLIKSMIWFYALFRKLRTNYAQGVHKLHKDEVYDSKISKSDKRTEDGAINEATEYNEITQETAVDKNGKNKYSSVPSGLRKEVKTMPLQARFWGTMIDKVFLLFCFTFGFFLINPYGAANMLGYYLGLLGISPDIYAYMNGDGHVFVPFGSESTYYMSYRELDLIITLSFLLINLVYYVVSETFLSASFYKRMFGGVLVDKSSSKIKAGKAFIRGLCGGCFMLVAVFVLHFKLGWSYRIVVPLFFILLDLPVFFTKRSLLDICTGTTYVYNNQIK
jgi:hypothetical protein